MNFTIDMKNDYPYGFRFDLNNDGLMPIHQIPELKNMVNSWLEETGIDYIYRQGLLWRLKNEQDATMFNLRFS